MVTCREMNSDQTPFILRSYAEAVPQASPNQQVQEAKSKGSNDNNIAISCVGCVAANHVHLIQTIYF